jgi:hypothetical protein
MPGLLRGVARTAVIAGTATSVSNRVSRRQAGRWAQQDAQQQQYQEPPPQYQQPPPQYQQPPPAPAAAPDTGNMIEQLKQLGELKDAGVLTEAEFAAQKSKILGG